MRRRGQSQEGWELFGPDGVRIGTVVEVRPEPGSHNPAWLLVRLTGLRRRLRAIPAGQAQWLPPGRLTVPYLAEQVLASPAARHEGGLQDAAWRRQAERYYRGLSAKSAR